jgi:hypothetical protein
MLCITCESHILHVNSTPCGQNAEVWMLQHVVPVYDLLCMYQLLYLRGLSGLSGQIHSYAGAISQDF